MASFLHGASFLKFLFQLMSALAAVGPPNPREDPECCSILHGLVAAVEALCQITELQHERRTALMDTAERVANRGRIICLTNAKRLIKNISRYLGFMELLAFSSHLSFLSAILMCGCWRTASRKPFPNKTNWQRAPTGLSRRA